MSTAKASLVLPLAMCSIHRPRHTNVNSITDVSKKLSGLGSLIIWRERVKVLQGNMAPATLRLHCVRPFIVQYGDFATTDYAYWDGGTIG